MKNPETIIKIREQLGDCSQLKDNASCNWNYDKTIIVIDKAIALDIEKTQIEELFGLNSYIFKSICVDKWGERKLNELNMVDKNGLKLQLGLEKYNHYIQVVNKEIIFHNEHKSQYEIIARNTIRGMPNRIIYQDIGLVDVTIKYIKNSKRYLEYFEKEKARLTYEITPAREKEKYYPIELRPIVSMLKGSLAGKEVNSVQANYFLSIINGLCPQEVTAILSEINNEALTNFYLKNNL